VDFAQIKVRYFEGRISDLLGMLEVNGELV
jgi:hypothetical protein